SLAALHAERHGRARLVSLDLARELDAVDRRPTVDGHDRVADLQPRLRGGGVAVDDLDRRGRGLLALQRVLPPDERPDPALLEGRNHALVDLIECEPVVEARLDEV